MNPAALKVHLTDLEPGGILIANTDSFNKANLEKAGYSNNPLEDGSLGDYRLFDVPISTLTHDTLKEAELTRTEKERSKNFFALGLMYWMFDRPMEETTNWLGDKFAKLPKIAEANSKVLKAGFYFGWCS